MTAEEAEHGREEHDESHEALLHVIEIGDPDHDDFGEAVEELTKALAHHLDEEERTILNPAREEVDDDCGSMKNVRRLVEASEHVEH